MPNREREKKKCGKVIGKGDVGKSVRGEVRDGVDDLIPEKEGE